MPAAESDPQTSAATIESSEASGQQQETCTETAMVEVGVDSLIVGRRLPQPVYDSGGILLAAQGAAVTQRMKQQLREHDVLAVAVPADDAARISLDASVFTVEPPALPLDSDAIRAVDSLLGQSGGLFVKNRGPAVRDRVGVKTDQDYDQGAREELVEKHAEVSNELDSMMHEAVHGENIDGRRIAQSTGEYLESMVIDSENVLTAASEAQSDARLSQHCLQMALVGMALGVEMGLDEDNVRTIGVAGMLHDWGMLRIPKELRESERVLTPDELIPIKRHPTHSLDLLQAVSGLPADVPLVCYQVHERPDGSGYPRGRSDGQIHPMAKILGVADAYVALTSPRSYRPALMPYAAMECLLTMAGERLLDSKIVRHLLHLLTLFPLHSLVALSDSSVARVIRRDGNQYESPVVRRLTDSEGNTLAEEDQSVLRLSDSDIRVAQALSSPGSEEIRMNDQILEMAYR